MGIRFFRINKYEPAADEKTLEELAAKGEFIKSQYAGIAVFRKGEPKKMRYCIEASTNMPKKKKLEAYKESGWSFAARATDANIFCTEDENAVPLHTDRSEYAHIIEQYHRSSLTVFVVLLIMLLLGYLGVFLFYNLLDYSVLNLMTYDLERESGKLISAAAATIFIGTFMIIYLIEAIRAGRFVAGCIENRKSAAKSVAVNGVMIACAAVMVTLAAGDIIFHLHCGLVNNSRDGELSELPAAAITAEDFVEPAPVEDLVEAEWYTSDSSLKSGTSALTDTWYEYRQYSAFRSSSGKLIYFPISGEYYEFRNTLTAKIAVDEIAGFMEGVYDGYNTSTKEHSTDGTGFDRIISITNPMWEDVSFFVRKGNVVQHIIIDFNEDFPDTETAYQKLIAIEI